MSDQYPGRDSGSSGQDPWGRTSSSDEPQPPYGQQQDPYGQTPYGQTPYGQQNPYGGEQNPYGSGSADQGYGAPYAAVDPDQRPGTVTAAGAITLVLSGLMGVLFLVLGVIMFAVSGQIVDEINQELANEPGFEEIGGEGIAVAAGVVLLLFALWCVIACVVAVFAMKRHNWARIVLVISASVTALVSLLGIGAVITAVPLISAIAVIVLLYTGGANEWYRSRGRSGQEAVAPGQTWG